MTKMFPRPRRANAGRHRPPVSATPPGFSLHDELANLVEAGLTPYQALRMATADAADFLRRRSLRDGGGGPTRGPLPLDADPLADIHATTRIGGVMVRGRWLPPQEIRWVLEISPPVRHPLSVCAGPSSSRHSARIRGELEEVCSWVLWARGLWLLVRCAVTSAVARAGRAATG